MVVDLDDADGLVRLWSEIDRVARHRRIDPKLRESVIRAALQLDADAAAQIVAELDQATPPAVLAANWQVLIPNRPAIGHYRRAHEEVA
ncbi:MAG: hypothetical protein ACYCTE_06810 [Acidimicrobiales bacterium]